MFEIVDDDDVWTLEHGYPISSSKSSGELIIYTPVNTSLTIYMCKSRVQEALIA